MGDAGEAATLHQNRCERMWSSGGGSLSKPSRRSAAEKSRLSLSLSLSSWASRLRRRESVDDAHGRGKRRLSGVGTGWLNNIDRYSVFGTRFKRSGQLASFSFSRVKGVYVWFKFKRFSRFLSFFFISLCTCYTSLYCFHLFSIRDTTGYWTNYHSFANLIWKL